MSGPEQAETQFQVRAEIAEPVRRVFGWMRSLSGANGIVCPDHGIRHTGKNAGLVVLAAELAKHDAEGDRDALFRAADDEARRIAASLEREGESTCFTFRPGRHDPYNCSNNAIDGGMCSDALAEHVATFGSRLSAEARDTYTRASVLHAQTYLRYAVLDKGIPAQRAWAMTGVAQAFSIARHEVLELAVTEGAGILEGVQNRDGSTPYHPLEWGAEHPGSSDVSAFYHSRVPAFTQFALERIGRNPADPLFAPPIERALGFLVALQGEDGIKVGSVEAKPWYWGAEYEVASHPFDVYALARGFHHFGRPAYADAAWRAFRAWTEHLTPAGEPRSHLPGPGRGRSYQCPVFWAGHAMWVARAMADLERIRSREDSNREAQQAARDAVSGAGGRRVAGSSMELSLRHFPDASLTRIEDGCVTAWVRGARPGFNFHHGSPHGGGLLRVFDRVQGRDLLARGPHTGAREGEWEGRAGRPSPSRGWRSGGREVRFSLWLARNHWRGGRRAAAFGTPLGVLKGAVLAPAGRRVSSGFGLGVETRLLPEGVELSGPVAFADGAPVPDSALLRRYRVDGDGLVVEEELQSAGEARGLTLVRPPGALEARVHGALHSYRLGGSVTG